MPIRWLRDAVLDLKELRQYIAQDNPHTAQDIARRIIMSVQQLRDNPSIAANAQARVRKTPRWLPRLRWAFLALVVLAALGLRAAGVPGTVAAAFGVAFGMGGVGFIVLWSRRKGVMTQCVAYCPIGAMVTTFGRISPFRLEIDEGCTECRLCTLVCRYRALEIEDLRRKQAGTTCTLCGDCLASCHAGLIRFRFPGLSPAAARASFVALVAAFHAVFLGVARI